MSNPNRKTVLLCCLSSSVVSSLVTLATLFAAWPATEQRGNDPTNDASVESGRDDNTVYGSEEGPAPLASQPLDRLLPDDDALAVWGHFFQLVIRPNEHDAPARGSIWSWSDGYQLEQVDSAGAVQIQFRFADPRLPFNNFDAAAALRLYSGGMGTYRVAGDNAMVFRDRYGRARVSLTARRTDAPNTRVEPWLRVHADDGTLSKKYRPLRRRR